MPRCPDDDAPLQPRPDGLPGCPRCGGVLASAEGLPLLVPGASEAALAVEARADSAAFAKERRCPDCDAVLTPYRIASLEAWADRCPSCSHYWLEKQDIRSLGLVARQSAVRGAYQSFSQEERATIARDLAEAEAEHAGGYPLSPLHETLASFGLPVIRRTKGDRPPLATWGLALLLVGVYVYGETAGGGWPAFTKAWGYDGTSPDALAPLTANLVHFGPLHLLGNLYFLMAFGDGAEQRLPRPLIWALFFVLGPASLLLNAWASDPGVLVAGASGGIAALMGACIVLQPQAQVLVRLGPRVVRAPILAYGAFELAYQAFMSMLGVPGTAWVAHLAGLVLGALSGLLLGRLWPEPAGATPPASA